MTRGLLQSKRSFNRFVSNETMKNGTINPDEVSKFSIIGEQWWNRSSSLGTGPLHAMNPARIEFIRTSLASVYKDRQTLPALDQLKNLSVLDVGCGGGILAESLARLGANVTAIDPSNENIMVAKNHSKKDTWTSNINYQQASIEDIVERGELYDAVCSLEVVEHVDKPHKFISSCIACVKPGGSLFLSTINRTTKSYTIAILGAESILKILPAGTHDWHKFITPDELSLLVTTPLKIDANNEYNDQYKMVVTNKKGIVIGFNDKSKSKQFNLPLPNWVLSDNDLDVNYIMHAIKIKK
jgi:ubiquinone biosynthesis O-methyltransferase